MNHWIENELINKWFYNEWPGQQLVELDLYQDVVPSAEQSILHQNAQTTNPLGECSWINFLSTNLYKYFASLGACMFVFNKRQKGWTNCAQFFCGISSDPRDGLFSMIKISKNSNIIQFSWNLKNLRILFIKSANFFCFCFII